MSLPVPPNAEKTLAPQAVARGQRSDKSHFVKITSWASIEESRQHAIIGGVDKTRLLSAADRIVRAFYERIIPEST